MNFPTKKKISYKVNFSWSEENTIQIDKCIKKNKH